MMHIVILSSEDLKKELLHNGIQEQTQLTWIKKPEDFLSHLQADAFMDLLFENTGQRRELLKQLLPAPVIVNSVAHTLTDIGLPVIRINAWPTFLKSALIEAHAPEEFKQKAGKIFLEFNKKPEWLPDEPGFITARVISMIINEAYISLEEGVSSKEDINTAMKLGTNYPFGPFEWIEKI